MLLDDLERGSGKEDDDNCSISEEDSELNYNYIVTFKALFEKTKGVAKGSKICARYKDDFEFDVQLKTWSRAWLYAKNIGKEAHLIDCAASVMPGWTCNQKQYGSDRLTSSALGGDNENS